MLTRFISAVRLRKEPIVCRTKWASFAFDVDDDDHRQALEDLFALSIRRFYEENNIAILLGVFIVIGFIIRASVYAQYNNSPLSFIIYMLLFGTVSLVAGVLFYNRFRKPKGKPFGPVLLVVAEFLILLSMVVGWFARDETYCLLIALTGIFFMPSTAVVFFIGQTFALICSLLILLLMLIITEHRMFTFLALFTTFLYSHSVHIMFERTVRQNVYNIHHINKMKFALDNMQAFFRKHTLAMQRHRHLPAMHTNCSILDIRVKKNSASYFRFMGKVTDELDLVVPGAMSVLELSPGHTVVFPRPGRDGKFDQIAIDCFVLMISLIRQLLHYFTHEELQKYVAFTLAHGSLYRVPLDTGAFVFGSAIDDADNTYNSFCSSSSVSFALSKAIQAQLPPDTAGELRYYTTQCSYTRSYAYSGACIHPLHSALWHNGYQIEPREEVVQVVPTGYLYTNIHLNYIDKLKYYVNRPSTALHLRTAASLLVCVCIFQLPGYSSVFTLHPKQLSFLICFLPSFLTFLLVILVMSFSKSIRNDITRTQTLSRWMLFGLACFLIISFIFHRPLALQVLSSILTFLLMVEIYSATLLVINIVIVLGLLITNGYSLGVLVLVYHIIFIPTRDTVTDKLIVNQNIHNALRTRYLSTVKALKSHFRSALSDELLRLIFNTESAMSSVFVVKDGLLILAKLSFVPVVEDYSETSWQTTKESVALCRTEFLEVCARSGERFHIVGSDNCITSYIACRREDSRLQLLVRDLLDLEHDFSCIEHASVGAIPQDILFSFSHSSTLKFSVIDSSALAAEELSHEMRGGMLCTLTSEIQRVDVLHGISPRYSGYYSQYLLSSLLPPPYTPG